MPTNRHHRHDHDSEGFVPAFGHDRFTPLYATLSVLTRPILRRFLRSTGIGAGMTVLDVGCGSGMLIREIKGTFPSATVVGVDVDPVVLDFARRALERAELDVELHEGPIETLDLLPSQFDRIVTTFVLHHLDTEQKRSMLAASRRLLRRDGQLHIADFGPPHTPLMRLVSTPLRGLGGERVSAGTSGAIPTLLRGAGFGQVEQLGASSTVLGTVIHWSAVNDNP